jgi:predicted neuraminidase
MTDTKFVFTETDLFPQCHGSTLVELPTGEILVAWFAGTRESHSDTAIWGSTLSSDGESWETPVKMFKINDEAHWNPVLMEDKGKIHIWFKTGAHPFSWETWHSVSDDSGVEWSTPELLKDQDGEGGHCRGPVRNKPIALSDGTWVAPSSHEEKVYEIRPKAPFQLVPHLCKPRDKTSYLSGRDMWNSFSDISCDDGKTWEKSEYVSHPDDQDGGGLIQPAVWESSPGNVHMMMRSTWGKIYRTDSSDGGKTWCKAYDTGMPNNNSGIEVVKLGDGILALVYNPVSGNWATRNKLSVAFSVDNGVTWAGSYSLESSLRGSYAYPSAIATKNGLAITYTWSRVSICCVLLDVDKDKILNGDDLQFCTVTNSEKDINDDSDLNSKLSYRLANKMTLQKFAKRERVQKVIQDNKNYGEDVVDWEAFEQWRGSYD